MITSAIIPKPLARLPWRLIFLVAAIAMFGLVVLYSAAGGSAEPWAIKQGLIFFAFLSIAIGMLYRGLDPLFEKLGDVSQLPPAMAAWAPDVVFALAGMYLLLRMRS